MRNLHQLLDCQYKGQIIGGDFAKFCGLLRIYELYHDFWLIRVFPEPKVVLIKELVYIVASKTLQFCVSIKLKHLLD